MPTNYKIPTIKELIEAGVHFGHQVKRWHPDMEPYIYTVRKNVHIIDLEDTEKLLKDAADFLYQNAKSGKKVVFVGTKKQARDIIEIEAKRAGAMYVTERWLGGTITNHEIIKKNNIDKMLDLKSKLEKGEFDHYTKKERLLIDREIERLERFVGGLANLKKLPDVLVVVDVRREKTAVREAVRAKIPVVALIDTNSDPEDIEYPIPGNDDAIKSIAVVVKTLASALEAGYKDYGEKVKEAKKEEKKIEEKTDGKPATSEVKKEIKKEVKTEEAKKEPVKKKSVEKKDKVTEKPKKTSKKPSKTKKEPEKKKPAKKPVKKPTAKKKRGRPKKKES